MYADIAVDVSVRGTFTYHLPPHLEGKLAAGHLVEVPFGTAVQPGIVLSLSETLMSDIEYTKPIHELLDPEPVVTQAQIDLARWMSDAYFAPISACLWLTLPPGIAGSRDIRVRLLDPNALSPDDAEQAVIDLLKKKGTRRGTQITVALPGVHWRPAVDTLAKEGLVERIHILTPPRVKPKVVNAAELAIAPDEIAQVEFSKRTSQETAERLRHILRVLAREDKPTAVSVIYAKTNASMPDLRKLEELGLVYLGEQEEIRDSLAKGEFVAVSAPNLTAEQNAAWKVIAQHIDQQHTGLFLLHGVTGSGKTEIYLQAIDAALAQGRQAIFLVPEIALTGQTVRRVMARFPNRTAVIHSSLPAGERYDTWRRARAGKIDVIVGTRSALFTPLGNIGVVILDEEHDHSYKQSFAIDFGIERSFYANASADYHARAVAEQMMRHNNGVLILGSATPDVETFYRAQCGELHYLHLPSRIMGHRQRIEQQAEDIQVVSAYRPVVSPLQKTPSDARLPTDAMTIDLPPVHVVDMRSELKAGNTGMFSRELHAALEHTLARHEQAILFLNRRGHNTFVFCRDCGYIAVCPRCDAPLTFHSPSEKLRCHRCGHEAPQPSQCPRCNSNRIKYFGAGTQQVELELRKTFPQARVLRWDADTAANHEAHENILKRFIQREADIIVGTQMVAKGLDLPLVTLVGVVSADMGIALPDFRAGERTFQLLTQVAGRAGRGLLGGQVVLQTYQPQHYAVAAASKHDYAGFYEQEIAYRRELGYPPYRRLARIVFRFAKDIKAQAEAERGAALLRERMRKLNMTGTEMIGPAPCFFHRIDGQYRWHIILRGPNPAEVFKAHQGMGMAEMDITRGWYVDIDPGDVL
jgi:primosomal protein N' (replication factor Y)